MLSTRKILLSSISKGFPGWPQVLPFLIFPVFYLSISFHLFLSLISSLSLFHFVSFPLCLPFHSFTVIQVIQNLYPVIVLPLLLSTSSSSYLTVNWKISLLVILLTAREREREREREKMMMMMMTSTSQAFFPQFSIKLQVTHSLTQLEASSLSLSLFSFLTVLLVLPVLLLRSCYCLSLLFATLFPSLSFYRSSFHSSTFQISMSHSILFFLSSSLSVSLQ